MGEGQRVDFFLSYAGEDVDHVVWMVDALEMAGFTTAYQARDFGPGSNFVERMHDALDSCDRVIALLSPAYLASSYCAAEWMAAFASDPTGDDRRLVPVRVRDCTPTGLLRTVVYIDLVGYDQAEATERLLTGVVEKRPGRHGPFPGGPPDGESCPAPAPEIRGNTVRLRRGTFIGRAPELEEATQLLSASPLLTVTGAGGVGKTRFAEQLAHQVAPGYADGAWLAELAPLREGDQVVGAVTAAVGLVGEPGRDPLASLVERLGQRQMLLVLDNCEHLVDAVRLLTDHLLVRCPNLQIVATSRQPLCADEETVWNLPPLPVPDQDDGSLADLRAVDSVRLFEDRGRKAEAGFALSSENAQAVSHICRRLDGIPLAIQLAAASLRHLSAQELAVRLDDWFLAGRSQGGEALARHETMYAAIDWSYQRLSPDEKELLARLAVFNGGFNLAAAESVCALGRPAGDVLDTLGRLIDRSLVMADRQHGATRFRLLEPVREFARALMGDGDEEDELRAAHAAWCLSLAVQAAVGIKGPDQLTWMGALDREEDNIRDALGFLLSAGPPTDALRLASEMGCYWFYRGRLAEGKRWLTQALEKATDAETALRVTAWIRLADLVGSSDRLLGLRCIERAVGITSTLADPSLGAWVLRELANAEWNTFRVDDARRHYEESVELARRAGDRRAEALAVAGLTASHAFRGDIEAAIALQSALVDEVRKGDDPWEIACALSQLGLWCNNAGHTERADEALDDALTRFRVMASPWGEGWTLCAMAEGAMDRRDLATACAQYEQALALFDRIGAGDVAGWAMSGLGYAALVRGDPVLARQLFESLLVRRAQIYGGKLGAASGFVPHMAALFAAEGNHELAARFLGGAAAARDRGSFPALYGKDLRATRQAEQAARIGLGGEGFARAWEHGSSMPMELLVEEALDLVGLALLSTEVVTGRSASAAVGDQRHVGAEAEGGIEGPLILDDEGHAALGRPVE